MKKSASNKKSVSNKKPISSNRISILALVVSSIALVLSAVNFLETRRANRINVQPILASDFIYNDKGTGWRLMNRGLGPGSMKWFEVSFDGKPMHTWRELVTMIGLPQNQQFAFIVPTGTYVADTDLPLFWVDPKDVTARNVLERNARRVSMKYCFCSLQDECWVGQNGSVTNAVDNCRENSRSIIHIHRQPEGYTHNSTDRADS